MSLDPDGRAHARQRWAARAALASAASAVALPLVYARATGLLVVAVGVLGSVVTVAALWWVLTRRGALRAAAVLLALATPAAVVWFFTAAHLLWVVGASLALWAFAVWAGKFALSTTRSHAVRVREYRTSGPSRPFLIMNPLSGNGKVDRFGLKEKAERLGARVHLLDPERREDVTELARRAADEGADLLGVAGGDGTQALVAAVAAEYGIPFLVVSAGTRNHFAMDLGLDRNDPSACLDALTTRGGVERRVDLGFVDAHPFVNNASFGAYAVVVQSPEYREDKLGTTLELLPELLTHQRGPRLTARIDVTGPRESARLRVRRRYGKATRPVATADAGRAGGGVSATAGASGAPGATGAAGAAGAAGSSEVLEASQGAGGTGASGAGAGGGGAGRAAPAGGPGTVVVDAPQALLVSNNPYRMDDPVGLGYRERLESGVLGVIGVKVESVAEAAGLLLGRHATGLTVLTAREVIVDADRPEVEVGVDGEAMLLPTPVRCRIEPRALRVRVPRNRPGVPEAKPPLDWRRLRKLAAAVGRTALPKHRDRYLPGHGSEPEDRQPPAA
ncbi:diacylglycerol/lipid kinase family protein [Streptomyces fructofermentans]|uniref:diacylglycerol/lipid kinase family protein n=1 Tax=Streptomyces fructofermentans TaxID=152141 RepID=UPI00379F9A60